MENHFKNSISNHENDLINYLVHFAKKTRLINFFTAVIMIFQTISLFFASLDFIESQFELTLLYIPFFSVMLFTLLFRDQVRSRGDVIYSELRSRHQSFENNNSDTDIERRIALGEYFRSGDLPLAPGRYGPAIYIVFSLILFFVALFFTKS